MNNRLITKVLVESHRQCPRRAWLEASGKVEPQFENSSRAMLEQGAHVHACGRSLFDGIQSVAGTLDMREACAITAALMADDAVKFIAEAAFVVDGAGVRVDVLERLDGGGFGIIEIKSGSGVKSTYLEDAAIQYAVVRAAGVDVRQVEIMHPSTKIARPEGGTGAEVLVRELVTDEVDRKSVDVPEWVGRCSTTITGLEPAIAPGLQCSTPHNCPFSHHCGKAEVRKNPDGIELLPSKSGKELRSLIAAGHRSISRLPSSAIQHAGNLIMYMALRMGTTVVAASFSRAMRELPYPRRFLDFETASFALPRFDGMRGHQSMVFQWSCHLQQSAEPEVTHSEFLDVSGNDPREPFVKSLLSEVGRSGPVLVFSAYERTQLKALAVDLPQFKDEIMALVGRLVDLLPMVRRGYYHPSQCGSWSIKKIEPTLPRSGGRKSYAELEGIAEGSEALSAYMDQTNPAIVGEQKLEQRRKMLEYCKLDTHVLVDLVEFVQSVGASKTQAVQVDVEDTQTVLA